MQRLGPVALLLAATACGGSSGVPRAASTPSPTPSLTTVAPAASPAPPSASRAPTAKGSAVATPVGGSSRTTAVPAAVQRASAIVHSVQVRVTPGGPVRWTLQDPARFGVKLTFLVTEVRGAWVHVLVPVRPNGSSGWVRASDVRRDTVAWRLEVRLKAHRLEIYRAGVVQRTVPVAVGRGSTPTPGGTYFVTALLRAPNPRGAYGPFAYALSGYSPVLQSFGGGDGQIALHGTNNPSSIGHDVSHGCIRMHNSDLSYLVGRLPLGTPVHINT